MSLSEKKSRTSIYTCHHTCMQAWVHVRFKHVYFLCSLKQLPGRDFCWGFSRNGFSRGQRISRGCLGLQGSHFRIQGWMMKWEVLVSQASSISKMIYAVVGWKLRVQLIWLALEARTFGVPPSASPSSVESFWSNSLQGTSSKTVKEHRLVKTTVHFELYFFRYVVSEFQGLEIDDKISHLVFAKTITLLNPSYFIFWSSPRIHGVL